MLTELWEPSYAFAREFFPLSWTEVYQESNTNAKEGLVAFMPEYLLPFDGLSMVYPKTRL